MNAESSLDGIRRKLQEHDAGAMTAFRSDNSPNETWERSRGFRAFLTDRRYSVMMVKGSYIENYGTGSAQEVAEEVLFAVDHKDTGKLKDDLIKLGRLADRDSVLWMPKGESGVLVGTSKREDAYPRYSHSIDFSGSMWGVATGAFFSRILGRRFLFVEGVSMSLSECEYPGTINGIRSMKICACEIEKQLEELPKATEEPQ